MGVDAAQLLDRALRAAREAGDLLIDGRTAGLTVDTKSSPTDVVTQMDRAAEALLHDRLLSEGPDDGILGEEGADVAGSSGVRWIVDPLDGTVNYLYGMRAWSVSIAAEVHGVAVAGVVHSPALGETYTATLDGGAWRDDAAGRTRLRVSDCADLASAMVGTGFGYVPDRRRSQAAVVAALLPHIRDIRRMGSCALDMSWVAAGCMDAYFERGPHPWDYTAASLIAREAGARVEGLRGMPASEELVIAATPAIFAALHDLLLEARADDG